LNPNFEWDPAKDESNLAKHGVSFTEAALIWLDPNRIERQDRWENGEERWQSIGRVGGRLLLLVAHTIREEGRAETVRIISARQAARSERRLYEQQ